MSHWLLYEQAKAHHAQLIREAHQARQGQGFKKVGRSPSVLAGLRGFLSSRV